MRFSKRYLVGLLVVAMAALLPSPASAVSNVSTVASHLDSPRGIAFINGRMVVAEAGHGGKTCFTPSPGITVCFGATSRISWVNPTTHTHTPLVKGLFSVMLPMGEGNIGVSGLTVSNGRIIGIIGGAPQEVPPGVSNAAQAGRLISVNPANGTWQTVAPVGKRDYNFTLKFTQPTPGVYSPGTQEHDSNPYGVLAADNGVYVADAGSNTLDFVSADGKITIVNYDGWRDPNPNNFPSDSVPTCVARADGAFWVGQLSGRLARIAGKSVTHPVPMAAGKPLLTHVTNCISGADGNLYFVNMFGPGIPFTDPTFFVGNVVKYNPRTGHGSVVAANLSFPNMAAFGPDGNLYVTTGSICPANGASPFPPGAPNPCVGGGKVLRINLH
ncbi:MAG: ScyD/ScyE family protein [Candidatus Dormibacteraeota bacterium]|nr:ScyD/ScyE family protein [Candidatus Dormibacteraeota bacterium]